MRMVELLDRAEGLVALMVDQPEYAVQLRGEIDTLRIMVAVEKADVAFKLMMEVRQKILDAYQEITRMQV